MAHTLCFSGMDRAEEAKLKLLFGDANEWLGGDWTLAPENSAEVLVIDLESIYGHMTWLKVQNSTRYVIALTSREQDEAEHLLLRPVTVESLVTALAEAIGKPVPQQRANVSASDAMSSAKQAGATSPQSAPRAPSRISKPLSQPIAEPANERAAVPAAPTPAAPPPPHRDVQVARAQDAQELRPMEVAPSLPVAPVQAQALPPMQDAPERPPSPPPYVQPSAPSAPWSAASTAKSRDPVLWDYLQQGKLTEVSKMELDGSPPLVIDPRNDTYIGGIALKPYIPYCQLGSVRAGQWQAITGPEIKQFKATLGEGQPLARLRWLHALVQGEGELAPGYDPEARFRLTRWPKTEREFPRHFRIATVMMQGPAKLSEIAAQSNTSLQEVNDFVNASLDSGFAEPFDEPPPTSDVPVKSVGLLGRLRGRT